MLFILSVVLKTTLIYFTYFGVYLLLFLITFYCSVNSFLIFSNEKNLFDHTFIKKIK